MLSNLFQIKEKTCEYFHETERKILKRILSKNFTISLNVDEDIREMSIWPYPQSVSSLVIFNILSIPTKNENIMISQILIHDII